VHDVQGMTWVDTGKTFKSKKAVDDHINTMTPSGVLDWRVGWYYVLRRDSDGICPHYQVVNK
jgi:hypothetical protein